MPLSAMVCGLSEALSVIVTEAALVPVAVGVKVTAKVQEVWGARLAGQLVTLKSEAGVGAMPLIERGAPPLFVTVTLCAVLLVPTNWPAKVKLIDDKLTTGIEVPLKVTV